MERSKKLPEILNNLLSEENIVASKKAAQEAMSKVSLVENDLSLAAQAFRKMITEAKRKPIEAGCGAVVAVINQEQDMLREFNKTVEKHAEALAPPEVVEEDVLPPSGADSMLSQDMFGMSDSAFRFR